MCTVLLTGQSPRYDRQLCPENNEDDGMQDQEPGWTEPLAQSECRQERRKAETCGSKGQRLHYSGQCANISNGLTQPILYDTSPMGIEMQVPVGTVVYVPQQQHNAELEVAVPDWILRPNEPWIGARDYTSDEDSSGDSGVAGPSSEVVLKQRLGREVADLSEEGQRHVLARGGQGGNGNAYNSSQQRR